MKLVDKNSKQEQPAIYKYLNKLVFNSNYFIPKELFWIDNAYINRFVFCNQKVVEDIKKAKINTVVITEIENIFDYIYNVGWINQKTKLIVE
ncbi:hypothetical protein D0T60_15840 [Bacteroides sp. 224]|nr:hypothetical protein [Bacteroides sp. 224]